MLTAGLGAELSAHQHQCSPSLRSQGASADGPVGTCPALSHRPGRQLRGKGRAGVMEPMAPLQGVLGDRT